MADMTFDQMLSAVKEKITWKVYHNDTQTSIFQQVDMGFFEEMSAKECKMRVRDIFKLAIPSTINNLTQALLEDSERVIDVNLFRECRSRIVGFQNGVFDLQTGKLRQYCPHDFVLNPLPHSIPEKLNPEQENAFLNVLTDWVGEDVADWFCNVLAYFLFIHPNEENLWLNFFEAGRNGKSSCLKLLEKIVGDDKVIGCDLQHINRFSNATFQGKYLILGRDSSHFISEGATSFIKNYTGDEKALVEYKGGASHDSYTSGKIIVSTNSLIQSKDRSFGWYRRFLPVPFPNTFPLDPKFEIELFKTIPHIIRILLHRAYCYRQNKIPVSQFLPEPVAKLKEEVRFINDRVAAFWEMYFFKTKQTSFKTTTTPDPERFLRMHNTKMSEVYDVFSSWHHDFFGDGSVEPSMKSFCGPHGAFMTHAKAYFTYSRRRDGRFLTLKPECLQQFEEDIER